MDLRVFSEDEKENLLAIKFLSANMQEAYAILPLAGAVIAEQFYKCCLYHNSTFESTAADDLLIDTTNLLVEIKDVLEAADPERVQSLFDSLVLDWGDVKLRFPKEG